MTFEGLSLNMPLPSHSCMPKSSGSEDRRMRKIRKKIQKVGKDLSKIHRFLEDLPDPIRMEVQRELQRAFEAGCAYVELQNLPSSMPIADDGNLQIGPELRYHILMTRKVYGDIDQLREIVADIFEEKSMKMLKKLLREQQETATSTEVTEIEMSD